jgi:hypothetical protein
MQHNREAGDHDARSVVSRLPSSIEDLPLFISGFKHPERQQLFCTAYQQTDGGYL